MCTFFLLIFLSSIYLTGPAVEARRAKGKPFLCYTPNTTVHLIISFYFFMAVSSFKLILALPARMKVRESRFLSLCLIYLLLCPRPDFNVHTSSAHTAVLQELGQHTWPICDFWTWSKLTPQYMLSFHEVWPP
jgi:hypothetical protein